MKIAITGARITFWNGKDANLKTIITSSSKSGSDVKSLFRTEPAHNFIFSKESARSCRAKLHYHTFPVAVEPVNDIFATMSLPRSASVT